MPEGNVLERLVEDRLASRADRAFEFIDPGIARHPARLDVRLGDALVIATEEGEEVLREVIAINIGQRADDAEIERDVLPKRPRRIAHKNVARVHVGMEEAVAEHLGEKDLDPGARQLLEIDTRGHDAVELADRNAVHALHDDHALAAIIPMHLGHAQQGGAGEIAPQLRAVGGLAHQVEFIVQIFVELGHHFARTQTLAVGPHALDQPGRGPHQGQILFDDRLHAGAQHLDRDLAPVFECGQMHLGDRGRGDRIARKTREQFFGRRAQRPRDFTCRERGIEGRHTILQPREFIGDVGRQQIAAGGQHLAELDEDGPEPFQRQAQAFAARRVQATAYRQHPYEQFDRTVLEARQHQFVEPVAPDDK